jgi:hypothetical protein
MAAMVFGVVGQTTGALLTFEDASGEGNGVGTIDIATFSGAIFAEKGSSPSTTYGFSGGVNRYDELIAPTPVSQFGDWFITDPVDTSASPGTVPFFGKPGTITVDFSIPVTEVSLWAMDINQNQREEFTAKIFSSGTLVDTISFTQTNADGDAKATFVDFNNSVAIDRLEMSTVLEDDPNGLVGWGVDNLSYTPIPEPTALAIWSLLGLTGVGACHWRRQRKR